MSASAADSAPTGLAPAAALVSDGEGAQRLLAGQLRRLLGDVAQRLTQTASSLALGAGRDLGCALCDRSGRVVAESGGDPLLSGSLGSQVAALLRGAPLFESGGEAMIAVSDPHPDPAGDGAAALGGVDTQTLTMVAPLLLPAGPPDSGDDSIYGYLAVRVRHPQPPLGQIWALGELPAEDDALAELPPAVGPRYRGFSQLPAALSPPRTLDDEGPRLAPTLVTDALLRSLVVGPGSRRELLGDLLAQRAALRFGIERLLQLLRPSGGEQFAIGCARLLEQTAAACTLAVQQLPDGFYAFADSLDDDGSGSADIAIRATCIVRQGRLQIDLRESDSAVPGPLNLVAASTLAVVREVLYRLLPASSPALRNDGLLRPVEVLLRPGSLLAAPLPYGLALGLGETAQRLADVLFGALAQALPQRIPAAPAGSSSSLFFSGPGLLHREVLAGGSGGRPLGSGAVQRGLAVLDHGFSAELLERRLPVRVLRHALRTESGGLGNAAGSDGQQRDIELLAPLTVTLAGERRRRPPYGLAGGGPGALGSDRIERDGPPAVRRRLPGKVALHGQPGDRLRQQSPGGAGHGDAQRAAFFAALVGG